MVGGFARLVTRYWGRTQTQKLVDEAQANPEDDMDQTLAIDAERRDAERGRYE